MKLSPKVTKTLLASAIVIIASVFGILSLQSGSLGLSPALVSSSIFIADLITVIIAVVAVDYLQGGLAKVKAYILDALGAGVVSAVVLTGFAGLYGATAFSGAGAVALALFLVGSVYGGIELGSRLKKR